MTLLSFVVAGLLWWILRPLSSPPRDSDSLSHECYVWQRVWDDSLRTSIRKAETDLQGVTVLAAEIDIRPDRRKQKIMPVDYSFLSSVSIPVGVAIRINPYSGPFDEDAPAAQAIHRTIEAVLKKAADAGFKPVEIQIDYDCAESKLAGYRQWVQVIQRDFPSYPIVITALPSWMNNRQFKKLVQDSDGYVLQVHSLERPKTINEQVTLCDPKRSVKWVQQADRLGVSFRLALPTYGYLVAYDEQGQFIGLSAEGAVPNWSENTQVKSVLSDPKKIAAIIQEIQTISPKNLSGVIWFRLPVAGDQLNWRWHTLQRIIQDQPLTEQIEVVLEWPQPNLAEVYLVNSGDVDVTGFFGVRLRSQDDCLAADGLRGYTVEKHSTGELLFSPKSQNALERLQTRKKIKIGWCRFNKGTEVNADIQVWK